MNSTNKTIFKNATFLMASQLITWGLSLALMVVLPRYLGPTAVGQFHLANSLWAIMGMLVSFGMDMYLTKAIARESSRLGALLGTSLIIRTGFFVIGFGIVAGYVYLVNYSMQAVWVIFIIGLANLLGQYSLVYRSALEGLERMRYIALGDICAKLFTAVVAIILLVNNHGIYLIASVFIGASLISLLIQLYFFHQTTPIRLHFDHNIAKTMLRESATYLSVLIFRTLYIQIDIVVISLLVNETVIGWYGAADSLFGTLLFVPTVFITAAFPALSRMYSGQKEELQQLMQRSFSLLLLISIPIGLGLFAIADNLTVLLFGNEFAPSGAVLAIMGIVLIFTYQNMLIGRFLIATNRQRIWSTVMAIATFSTIPLDLLLIPWCQQAFGNGGIGGALAFVFTECGMLIAGLYYLPKGSLTQATLWRSLRALAAGAIMALVVWQLRSLFIIIPIFAGALIYGALILLFGVVPKEDLKLLQVLSSNVLLKIRRAEAPAG